MTIIRVELQPSGGGGGGVLGISGDGDDERIFLGFKFLIPGFFLGTKILQVFFWVAWFE